MEIFPTPPHLQHTINAGIDRIRGSQYDTFPTRLIVELAILRYFAKFDTISAMSLATNPNFHGVDSDMWKLILKDALYAYDTYRPD
jgi:hypothetical protein